MVATTETKKEMAVAEKKTTTAISTKITPANIVVKQQEYLAQLCQVAASQGNPLTAKQKEYAVPIINKFATKIMEEGYVPERVNASNFLEQVKSYARLGLSIQEEEIWLDFRNNGKTNMVDVNISKQYQGVQKLILKHCDKKIIRFMDGIVCDGDTFVVERDFDTGLTKIKKHVVKNDGDRNNFEKINGAFAIAYAQEGNNIVPYTCVVDRQRLVTARNGSPSKEKAVWNKHTAKMVIKTAYWELLNAVLKPFINIPNDLKQDWENTSDKMEFLTPELNMIYNIDEETGEVLSEISEQNSSTAETTNESTKGELPPLDDFPVEEKEKQAKNAPKPPEKPKGLVCADCGTTDLTERNVAFSREKYGQDICYGCQMKRKNA